MNPQDTPNTPNPNPTPEPTPTPPAPEATPTPVVEPAPAPVAAPEPIAPQPVTAPQPTPVTPETPVVPPVAPVADTPVKKKGKFPKWLAAILIVIAILIALGVALYFFVMSASSKAEEVSNQAINSLQAGNSTALYAQTSEEFKAATSEEQLATLVAQISAPLQGEEKISERSVNSQNGKNYAVFVYTVESSDGSGTKYVKIITTENDGVWQIQNLRASESKLEADLTTN